MDSLLAKKNRIRAILVLKILLISIGCFGQSVQVDCNKGIKEGFLVQSKKIFNREGNDKYMLLNSEVLYYFLQDSLIDENISDSLEKLIASYADYNLILKQSNASYLNSTHCTNNEGVVDNSYKTYFNEESNYYIVDTKENIYAIRLLKVSGFFKTVEIKPTRMSYRQFIGSAYSFEQLEEYDTVKALLLLSLENSENIDSLLTKNGLTKIVLSPW